MVYPADRTTCLPAQVTYAFRVNSNALICIALDSVSLTQYNTGTDNPSRKLVMWDCPAGCAHRHLSRQTCSARKLLSEQSLFPINLSGTNTNLCTSYDNRCRSK